MKAAFFSLNNSNSLNKDARRPAWVSAALLAGLFCLYSTPAIASNPCDQWTAGATGVYSTGTNWATSPNPPASGANICVVDGVSTVNVNASANIGSLTLGNGSSPGNILSVNGGSVLTINGPTVSTSASGDALKLNATGGVAYLYLTGSVTLSGSGSLTLQEATNNNNALIYNDSGSETLTNAGSTIQGAGLIGDTYNMSLVNQTGGVVNANVSGFTLTVDAAGGTTNQGLMEATGGGTLNLSTYNVNNTGGTISTDSSSVVQLTSLTVTGGTLSGNGIQSVGANFVGPLNNQGILTVMNGSATGIQGAINNTGSIVLASTGGEAYLNLTGDTTLSGGGALTLQNTVNGANTTLIYNANSASETLTNFNNTISGQGAIGDTYNMKFVNQAGGIVDANVSGQTLMIDAGGGTTNQGLMEATGGGKLEIYAYSVDNTGATISADSTSTVELNSTTITGGTLSGNVQSSNSNLVGPLNNQGTLTVMNGTITGIQGAINNTGSILLASTGSTAYLNLTGDTTLSGGGTVTLQNTTNNGLTTIIYNSNSGSETLTNFNNTISGQGAIGDTYNMKFVNQAAGIVNANVSGQTLTLDAAGGTINQGLLEATGGSTLEIYAYNVNNQAGIISAGAGSTVQLNSTTIQGGILQGNIQSSASTLDGATLGQINNQGALTVVDGNSTTVLGTINNTGSIVIASTTGAATSLNLSADTTLTGGGTVTLQNPAHNGNAYIWNSNQGSETLTNFNNTIEGEGQIGTTYNMQFLNQSAGIVNANVSGQTLTVSAYGGTTNQGLMEATGGGILAINGSTVNNFGGLITADAGSTVTLTSTTIQGGTLSGNVESFTSTLDGSTHGQITNQGTFTVESGYSTTVLGTINNTGSILLASTGGGTSLTLAADTTLTGGGTVTLQNSANNGNAYIWNPNQDSQTLTNFNNTIQGQGAIGAGYNMKFDNEAGGTVLANVSGQTLTINSLGGLTNAGTLQVNTGSTMVVASPFASSTFTGGTLETGTYIVNGTTSAGILQLSSLGTLGGEITSNGASITLNGPLAAITDASNLSALANFQDNLASGSFTVEGGQEFVTNTADGESFTNAGAVDVAAGSGFTTGGDYTQTGGTTQVDGTLTATGGQVSINGGTLSGVGTIAANVTIGANGAISPGDPGTMSILGNYLQNGTLGEQIAGAATGQFDVVAVTGTAALGAGSILDILLLNGFTPTANQTFTILTSAGLTGTFGTIENLDYSGGYWTVDYTGDDVILDANANPTTGGAVPEPAAYLPIVGIMAELIRRKIKAGRKNAASVV